MNHPPLHPVSSLKNIVKEQFLRSKQIKTISKTNKASTKTEPNGTKDDTTPLQKNPVDRLNTILQTPINGSQLRAAAYDVNNGLALSPYMTIHGEYWVWRDSHAGALRGQRHWFKRLTSTL